MVTLLRQCLEWNTRLSRRQRSWAARLLPDLAQDGAREFHERVLRNLLSPGIRILDVGGGKHPAIPLQIKQDLGLHVVGLDISEAELLRAPRGGYDSIVVGDVASVSIPGVYDLIFSRSVIEHLKDPRSAITNLSSVLAPGGTMAHFMPCRNAPFAMINRWLGNRVARQVLFAVFPDKRKASGFPAFYRYCTPRELSRLLSEQGLEILSVIPYYKSDYAAFFAPFYTIEILRQTLMCCLRIENCAETFSIIARAQPDRVTNALVPPLASSVLSVPFAPRISSIPENILARVTGRRSIEQEG